MDIVFRTILEEGDEVIIPAPIYTGYEPLITLAGATPIYLDTTKTDFIPDPTQLEQLITPKTKAIVFNYPSNPTGVTIPRQTMDELAATLAKHEFSSSQTKSTAKTHSKGNTAHSPNTLN